MSNWAMGWAQRQKLGDPIAKSVLYTMCYVMRDDTLAVYVGIPTLQDLTEFEDRAIRKAIQRLLETGVLLDTGMRRNNVPVYRIPGYEAWLTAQQTSPLQDGRASSIDTTALAQVAELTAQKRVGKSVNSKPPQVGEGHDQALPSSSSSPPVNVPQALPNTGGNLNPDQKNLNPSAGAREIPSGSRAAQTPEQIEARDLAAKQLRSTWSSHIHGQLFALAWHYDAGKFQAQGWADLTADARAVLPAKCAELIDRAIVWSNDIPPRSRKVIEQMIDAELVLELKQFRGATVAERAAAHAA